MGENTFSKLLIVTFVSIFLVSNFVYAQSAQDTITITAQVNAPIITGGGGGGGGGGNYTPPTDIVFSGSAYPLSKVIVLMNGQEVVRTIAGPDSKFSVSLNSLTAGTYTFSVVGEDYKGIRSTLFTFPIMITAGASTTVSGIFIAPTIDTDKIEVKKGDNITIFGQTAQNSTVTISVHSNPEYFFKTNAGNDGTYLYTLDSSVLALGEHETKSKATLQTNEISSFGKTMTFTVGDENIAKNTVCRKYDLNCDGKINLIDFSILAYWYHRVAPPDKVDMNSDGAVTLTDFSIIAYYWTG